MAKKLKCWKKVRGKGNLWENNSRSQKAQRHIIMRVGVTPIGTEGKFVPYKEIEDEKFLTSNIVASLPSLHGQKLCESEELIMEILFSDISFILRFIFGSEEIPVSIS